MDKNKVIGLLNLDLQDEHGAIIQYLTHAYSMGEGEEACEIEAIARDEMRHLDWLAETIVELGGKPSLNRGTMNMAGKTVSTWMANDAQLEQGAIDNYAKHIKMIDDTKIKRLLKRIRADEEAHRAKFEHFIDKVKKAGLKDNRGNRKDDITRTLDWGIQHEYTVVLQYLFHSYMLKNREDKKQLEDQAVNEMQHMGWLAEEMVDAGGSPWPLEPEVEMPSRAADMLNADIKIEKEVAEKYDKAAKEIDDAGLKALLLRIRDNERYHIEVFNDLIRDKKNKK